MSFQFPNSGCGNSQTLCTRVMDCVNRNLTRLANGQSNDLVNFCQAASKCINEQLFAISTGSETLLTYFPASVEAYLKTISGYTESGDIFLSSSSGSLLWQSGGGGGGGGTVTSIAAGNGMDFSTITTSGSIVLGTPSNITLSSTNSVTTNSHTHAFVPGGSSGQYIRGDGTLATFPTIPATPTLQEVFDVEGDIAVLTAAQNRIDIGSNKFIWHRDPNQYLTLHFGESGNSNGPGIFNLDDQSYSQIGFKYIGMDPGFVRNQVENTLTPTDPIVSLIPYINAASGFSCRNNFENTLAQFYLGVLNNPFANKALMIRMVGGGIRMVADSGYISFGGNAFDNGTGNYARFLSNGNFGIATATPSEKLEVVGNVKFSGVLMPNNLPGTAGQVLTSAGASTPPTWETPTTGTVTSVDVSAGTGINISGSPITSSGTITVTNTAPDQTVVLTQGTGISITGTYPSFTITNSSPSSGGTVTSFSATDGNGFDFTVTNPTTTPTLSLTTTVADGRVMVSSSGAISGSAGLTFSSGTLGVGASGSIQGVISLQGSSSGAIAIQPQAAAGTYNFNLPTSAGSSGQPLLSGGGGATAMSFGTLTPAGGGIGITSGTSGGVLYFSSTSTIASSALLAANALVIGGGAGVAPSTTTTASGILTFIGTPSSANLAAALTDETGGAGLAVFNSSPTIITPSFTTGFTISGVAASGTFPRGNGTNFVASTLTIPNTSTANRIVYSTATSTYGESANLTFDGSIFTQTSAVTTGTTTTSAKVLSVNSLTSGTGFYIASSTLSSGKIIDIAVTGTAGATGQTGVNVSLSGANSSGGQTTTAAIFSNTHTGTSANVGAEFIASGGSSNTAIKVASGNGRVAIGQNTANASLDVVGTAILDAIQTTSVGVNGNFFTATTVGSTTSTTTPLLFDSATTVGFRISVNGTTATALTANASYASVIFGASAITEAATGTHPLISTLALIPPTITGAAGAVTNTATFVIKDAPSASGATNYSMWVKAGLARMDAGLNFNGSTSPIQLNGSAGTSGNILTSAGAGNTPTWTAPSSLTGLPYWALTGTSTLIADSVIAMSGNRIEFTTSASKIPTLTISGETTQAFRPYKVYTALLTQSGPDAPTAIVLENTLGGDVEYSYSTNGNYIATCTGRFIEDKTAILPGAGWDNDNGAPASLVGTRLDVDTVLIRVGSMGCTGCTGDGWLTNTFFEIRVYY